jgi:hypothetical protein
MGVGEMGRGVFGQTVLHIKNPGKILEKMFVRSPNKISGKKN